MRKLGRVLSGRKGELVIRTEESLRIGAKIYDEKERFIGTVKERIASTKQPYTVIKTEKPTKPMIGKTLYH